MVDGYMKPHESALSRPHGDMTVFNYVWTQTDTGYEDRHIPKAEAKSASARSFSNRIRSLTCTARCDRAERLGPDRPVEEVVLACWAAAPSPLRKPERLPQPHPLDVG